MYIIALVVCWIKRLYLVIGVHTSQMHISYSSCTTAIGFGMWTHTTMFARAHPNGHSVYAETQSERPCAKLECLGNAATVLYVQTHTHTHATPRRQENVYKRSYRLDSLLLITWSRVWKTPSTHRAYAQHAWVYVVRRNEVVCVLDGGDHGRADRELRS